MFLSLRFRRYQSVFVREQVIKRRADVLMGPLFQEGKTLIINSLHTG